MKTNLIRYGTTGILAALLFAGVLSAGSTAKARDSISVMFSSGDSYRDRGYYNSGYYHRGRYYGGPRYRYYYGPRYVAPRYTYYRGHRGYWSHRNGVSFFIRIN